MNVATLSRREFRGTDPARKAIGWAIVLVVHVLLGWALVSGTARKSFERIVNKPIEAAVIQEVTIPPPPPPPPPPRRIERTKAPVHKPKPKPAAPPPPYVPPPEIAQPPAPTAPAVPSVPTPPATPPAVTPPAAVGEGVAGPAGPARGDIGLACPVQVKPEMPRRAVREGIQGTVKAQALIRNGAVKEVTILSGPAVYHQAVRDAMMQYKCVSGPGDVIATQNFVFRIAE